LRSNDGTTGIAYTPINTVIYNAKSCYTIAIVVQVIQRGDSNRRCICPIASMGDGVDTREQAVSEYPSQ
jgi:hypothetical protein